MPEVAVIGEAELPEVARYFASEPGRIGNGAPASADDLLARMRWLLAENPARTAEVPFGWALREGGAVVGACLCFPQRFATASAVHTVVVGGAYFVAEQHRGAGLALFMRYLQLGKRFPLLATSANASSSALWQRFGAYAIPGTDREGLVPLRWAPLLEEALSGRVGATPARVAAVPAGALLDLVRGPPRLRGPEARVLADPADLAPLLSAPGPELTAVRDAAFLRWRYGGRAGSPVEVLALASGGFAAINFTRRGRRGQIRAANVLDLASPADALGALAQSCRGRADVLVLRCLPAPWHGTVRPKRMIERKFQSSTAWCLDRAGLLPTREWRLTPADGDMAP